MKGLMMDFPYDLIILQMSVWRFSHLQPTQPAANVFQKSLRFTLKLPGLFAQTTSFRLK